MNRRKLLAGLGAALLMVPLLPVALKTKASEWSRVGWLEYSVTQDADGKITVQQTNKPIKWGWAKLSD